MKTLILTALAVLSFAGVAHADSASCNDSRLINTLPSGTKIIVGRSMKALATTGSIAIGSTGCAFSFNISEQDRITPPNMVVLTTDTSGGGNRDSLVNIVAMTSNREHFDLICDQERDGAESGLATYKQLTVGDIERVLETVGGQIVLPPAQPF